MDSLCVCVCYELHGLYLFRLCGSIFRISSTCYPGVCVCVFGTDLAPGVFSFYRGSRGFVCDSVCVCAETCPTPFHTRTLPHTSKNVDVGQCQKLGSCRNSNPTISSYASADVENPGKSGITRSVPAQYSEIETSV